MKKNFLAFIYLSIGLLVYWIITPVAFAANEFQTDYDIQYSISPTGVTTVTQKITLTNLLSNYYPQKYSLLIDSDKITSIIAYDNDGVIVPAVSILDGKTQIGISLNAKNVGLGKSTNVTLRYTHGGIASKNGAIWELYIPGVVNDPDIDRYNVTLHVPDSFGKPAYLSPKPKIGMTWDRDQMIRGGVAGAYGTAQVYELALKYELTNTSSQTQQQQIALPPDTNRQKIIIDSLIPKPETVTKDEDGNWLAQYIIPPKDNIAISASLRAFVYFHARTDFPHVVVGGGDYTMSLDYWQSQDPEIRHLASALDTPEKIYNFVVEKLDYDLEKNTSAIKRLGALEALKQPTSAVCMEFTDLFIAIARARGIPARRLVGYAYTDNARLRPVSLVTDVLHTWPEYYDTTTGTWIPVDPTWGDTTGGLDYFTKLDFNHIVFAIHGSNSSLPYPAGFYHDPAIEQKDVSVQFATETDFNEQSENIQTSILFPKRVWAGFTSSGTIIIENASGQRQQNIPYDISAPLANIALADTLLELLPYQHVEIPITGNIPFTPRSLQSTLLVSVGGAQYRYPFIIVPYVLYLITFGLVLAIGLSVWIKKLKTN